MHKELCALTAPLPTASIGSAPHQECRLCTIRLCFTGFCTFPPSDPETSVVTAAAALDFDRFPLRRPRPLPPEPPLRLPVPAEASAAAEAPAPNLLQAAWPCLVCCTNQGVCQHVVRTANSHSLSVSPALTRFWVPTPRGLPKPKVFGGLRARRPRPSLGILR